MSAWVSACNAIAGQTDIQIVNQSRYPCKIRLQVAGVVYREAFLPSTRYGSNISKSLGDRLEALISDDASEDSFSCASSSWKESSWRERRRRSLKKTSSASARVINNILQEIRPRMINRASSSLNSTSTEGQWEAVRNKQYEGTKCTLGYSPTAETPCSAIVTIPCGYIWYKVIAQKVTRGSFEEEEWVNEPVRIEMAGVYGGSKLILKDGPVPESIILEHFTDEPKGILDSEPVELHQTPLAGEVADKMYLALLSS